MPLVERREGVARGERRKGVADGVDKRAIRESKTEGHGKRRGNPRGARNALAENAPESNEHLGHLGDEHSPCAKARDDRVEPVDGRRCEIENYALRRGLLDDIRGEQRSVGRNELVGESELQFARHSYFFAESCSMIACATSCIVRRRSIDAF